MRVAAPTCDLCKPIIHELESNSNEAPQKCIAVKILHWAFRAPHICYIVIW